MRASNFLEFFYAWLACKTSRIDRINAIVSRSDRLVVEFMLRLMNSKIGKDADIESYLKIHGASRDYSNLRIGNACHIGKDVFLDLTAPIIIEDEVTISMRTTILTHIDVGKSPLGKKLYPTEKKGVVLRKGCYIGANVTILMGVTVGECAVVGAGSVITKDVPANTVVVGYHAKVAKELKL
ncbi:acyltransferase [Candidatus Omnitrophota bacterium]